MQKNLWFHQFCSVPWGQSKMPKVLCYPQCFTLTIVLELNQPSEETGSNTREKKGVGGGVRMWKDVLSFQSPNEVTPEVHSLWGCTALQGLMPNSEKEKKKKKQVNEETGEIFITLTPVSDADHPVLHKVHKHTGFNVSVNALRLHHLPQYIFSSLSLKYSKM